MEWWMDDYYVKKTRRVRIWIHEINDSYTCERHLRSDEKVLFGRYCDGRTYQYRTKDRYPGRHDTNYLSVVFGGE